MPKARRENQRKSRNRWVPFALKLSYTSKMDDNPKSRAIQIDHRTNGIKKHPGGAPPKITSAAIDKARHYAINYADYGDKIPSVAGLSVVLGIRREHIHVYISKNDGSELANIIKLMMSGQERILLNNGLDGTFNSNIAKLVLSKHGYTDKVDGNQGVAVNITINRGGESVTVSTGGQTLDLDDLPE